MPELGLSPLVTQTLDNDYSWLWSPDIAVIFLVVQLVPPLANLAVFFKSLGYAPEPIRQKHFGVAWPDDPAPDAAVSRWFFLDRVLDHPVPQ